LIEPLEYFFGRRSESPTVVVTAMHTMPFSPYASNYYVLLVAGIL